MWRSFIALLGLATGLLTGKPLDITDTAFAVARIFSIPARTSRCFDESGA
jgi:hypothetical protein